MFGRFVKNKNIEFSAFLNGELKPITEVPDPVFAEKMMGDGIAIVPDAGDGTIYAPCAGNIFLIMPTKHAIGIIMENGIEVLLHLGLETCTLNGEGFDIMCKIGDKVLAKQKLGSIKRSLLDSKEINMISMMVITKADNFSVRIVKTGSVNFKDRVVELVRS